MRIGLIATTALLMTSQIAQADVGTPGFSRVTKHLEIAIDGNYPGYRFWLVSMYYDTEPVELIAGQTTRIDGSNRGGRNRFAYVVAAPVQLSDQIRAAGKDDKRMAELIRLNHLLQSDKIDFREDLPFFDNRTEVVDAYRVAIDSGSIKLVYVSRTSSPWCSWACLLFSIFASIGVLWFGYRLIRKLDKKRNDNKNTGR